MTLDVESVVRCGMKREKSLRGCDALEPLHLPLPSSGRLMRILRSVVAPSTALMAFCDPEMNGRRPIRAQVVCDELVGDKATFLQKLTHHFERRMFVSPGLDQNVEHFALGIHGTPEVTASSWPRKAFCSRDCPTAAATAALSAFKATSSFGVRSFELLGQAASANFTARVGLAISAAFDSAARAAD